MLKEGETKKIFGFYWTMLEPIWFLFKIKVRDWVERNFFSLTVFGWNLLAGDVHSSVTMDRHVQLASAYSLEF